MRSLAHASALAALLGSLALAGCGSSDSPAGEGGAAAPPPAGVDFTVGEVIDQSTNAQIPQVQLCIYGTSSCATTDDKGHAVVPGAPESDDFLLEASLDGYFPTVFTLTTKGGARKIDTVQIVKNALTATLFAAVGVTADPAKGHVVVIVYDGTETKNNGLPGATFTLSPASGEGPSYLNDDGLPDPTYASTSSAGYGVVANVNPGDVEISLDVGGRSCVPSLSGEVWTSGESTKLRAKIVAGHVTSAIELRCK